MSTTKTASSSTTAVIATGAVESPLMLTRSIPERIARVSFRIDGEQGPYNVHASGHRAEMIRAAVHKGDRVTITALCATYTHPAQTVPDLEVETIEVARRDQ